MIAPDCVTNRRAENENCVIDTIIIIIIVVIIIIIGTRSRGCPITGVRFE